MSAVLEARAQDFGKTAKMAEVDLTQYNVEHKRVDSFFTPPKPIAQERIDWAEAEGFVVTTKSDGRVRIFGGDEDERTDVIIKLIDESIPLDDPESSNSGSGFSDSLNSSDSSDSDEVLSKFGKFTIPKDEETDKEKKEKLAQREKELLERRAKQASFIPKIVRTAKAQPQPRFSGPPRKQPMPEKKKPVFKPVPTSDIKSVGWGEVKVKADVVIEKAPEAAPPPPPKRKSRYTHSSSDDENVVHPFQVNNNRNAPTPEEKPADKKDKKNKKNNKNKKDKKDKKDKKEKKEEQKQEQKTEQKPAPKPAPKPKKVHNKFGMGVAEEVVDIPLEDQVPDLFVKPKVIEDDLRRSLYFAFESYREDMTDDEIRNTPAFKMNLRNEGSLKPVIAAIRNIVCPPLTADFIIECFSATMPKELVGVANKCTRAPTAHRILLPSMLPVSFTLADDKVVMAFFDTPGVCAVETETMVKAAIDVFQNRDVTTYSFNKVGKGVVTPAKVAELAKECGSAAVMSRPVGDDNVVSYTISVMKVRWNAEKEAKFDKQIRDWFEEVKLVKCKTCKKAFHIGDGSVCEERYHPGERQATESGEMEVLMTVNNEEKHMVSFTCCGDCFIEDPGCKVRVHEKHDPAEVISSISSETDKIL